MPNLLSYNSLLGQMLNILYFFFRQLIRHIDVHVQFYGDRNIKNIY